MNVATAPLPLQLAVPARTTRLPTSALWLLSLLPGCMLVVLDLARHVVRPEVWTVRFFPAGVLVLLAAWAERTPTPFARRMASTFRQTWEAGVTLMLGTGLGLLLDAVPREFFFGLVSGWAMIAGLSLPAVMLAYLLWTETAHGTLAVNLTQPLARRWMVEKFSLVALMVTLAWLQQVAAWKLDSPEGRLLLAATLMPLSGTLLWWALTRNAVLTGLLAGFPSLLVMFGAVLEEDFGDWVQPVAVGVMAVIGVVSLALTPRLLRTWPLTDNTLGTDHPMVALRRLPIRWSAELLPQRLLFFFPFIGLFSVLVTPADENHATSLMLVILSVGAAALSPGIALTEGLRNGTLDLEYALRPRAAVFTRKVASAAMMVLFVSVIAPLALQELDVAVDGVPHRHEPLEWLGWALMMGFVFIVSTLLSSTQRHAGATLMLSVVGAFVLAVVQVGLTETVTVLTFNEFAGSRLHAAAFVNTSLILMALTWVREVKLQRAPKWVAGALALCLLQAIALGVGGTFVREAIDDAPARGVYSR